MLKAYRIESEGMGICSKSASAGILMSCAGLFKPPLDYSAGAYQHWFTRKGYRKMGEMIIALSKAGKHQIHIRTALIPSSLIQYFDEFQVVILWEEQVKIIPWKLTKKWTVGFLDDIFVL